MQDVLARSRQQTAGARRLLLNKLQTFDFLLGLSSLLAAAAAAATAAALGVGLGRSIGLQAKGSVEKYGC